MRTKESRRTKPEINRAKLGAGPWEREPHDRITWESGDVLVVLDRRSTGYWAVALVLPAGHPMHGQHVDDCLPESFWSRFAQRFSGGVDYGQPNPGATWVLGVHTHPEELERRRDFIAPLGKEALDDPDLMPIMDGIDPATKKLRVRLVTKADFHGRKYQPEQAATAIADEFLELVR
jgi:hypothetical protein